VDDAADPEDTPGVPRHAPTCTTLGRVLRDFRDAAGLSQEKFGFRAKLHRNYVSGVEVGRRNPTFEVLERWLAALGVTWAEFGAALDRAAARDRHP